jgi:hypothetical protein
MFYDISASGGFHKEFTFVTYSPSKISSIIIHCTQAGVQFFFQNALAYFATAVSYVCKMCMSSTPGAGTIKRFSVVIVAVS